MTMTKEMLKKQALKAVGSGEFGSMLRYYLKLESLLLDDMLEAQTYVGFMAAVNQLQILNECLKDYYELMDESLATR